MDGLIDAPGLPGYTNGERWNGFACPFFERAEAEQIAAAMERQQPGSARYEVDTDTFIIGDTGDTEADEFAATGKMVATVDGPKMLYPVGTCV